MKTEVHNTILQVSEVQELTAGTAIELKEEVRLRFVPELTDIELHCEGLEFVDSSGLGTLISMQKLAVQRGGSFRIINPSPSVMQVLELTQLHRIFTIIGN
jgi:anti-sigma B factor antagonist